MTEIETTGTVEKRMMKVSSQGEEGGEVILMVAEAEIIMEEEGGKDLEGAEEGMISLLEEEVAEEGEEGMMATISQEGVVVEEVDLMTEVEGVEIEG